MGGMAFLPGGFPFGGTTLGQGSAQPNTGAMTPEQLIEYYTQLANTPQGQAAVAAQQQTIAMNVKQANAALQAERDRIAIAKGQAEADKWYKQESLKLAQQAHQLAVQTQQQNYELSGAALTGQFQGNPTLANQAQTAMYTGLYNGQQTLQAQNQAQQFGLQQAGITGQYQGSPTLQAQNQAQQYGLQLGAQTGYQGGQATLSREQAAANAALQAAQLGASLQGPANYAQYLQAANAVAGSPASALVASAPGGLGQMQGDPGGPMTLAGMLSQYGVMPGQGPSQPQQGGQAFIDPYAGTGQTWTGNGGMIGRPGLEPYGGGGQMFAGGTPGFNEQTGSYSSAPAGGMRSTMPVGSQGQRQTGTRGYSDSGTVTTQQQGWNPQSVTGAIGQAASAPRVTNAQLGLTDEEAATLQNYFRNPHQSSAGWYESKSKDQKAYLSGLNQMWGGSPDTFEERYRNSRPRQAAWNAAV